MSKQIDLKGVEEYNVPDINLEPSIDTISKLKREEHLQERLNALYAESKTLDFSSNIEELTRVHDAICKLQEELETIQEITRIYRRMVYNSRKNK